MAYPGVGKNLIFANVVGIAEASQIKAIVNSLVQQIQQTSSGLMNAQTGSVGNAADTTDDTLFSFILPANWLAAIGTNSGLRIKVWGTSAANGNNKTFKLFFGSVTAISSGVVTINAKSWHLMATVLRSGVSTQKILGEGTSDAVDLSDSAQDGTEDETAAITVKATGASGTTGAANDLLGKGFVVEVLQ